MTDVIVRPAAIEEAPALTALANRAPAGRTPATAVRIEPGAIAEGWVWVAQDRRRRVLGVATLRRTDTREVIELGGLHVETGAQEGAARQALIEHLSRMARDLGARTLRFEPDPAEAAFYQALGARRIGESDGPSGQARLIFELQL
jgi:GNAT superfamily N-acetyltransferase